MLKTAAVLLCAVFLFVGQACTQHKVEVAPVEIKPIHITIDVNIKVDKALDDFFGDIDDAENLSGETPSGKK